MLNRRSLVISSALSFAGTRSMAQNRSLVLGFAQVGAESQWRAANTKSIQESAEAAGVKLQFVDGQGQQALQIQAIRSFIQQKVDVIALAPVVTTGWDEVLTEAKKARIPVILTDRSVETQDDNLYITTLGSDFTEEGRRAGRWLLRNAKPTGTIRIVELQGSTGSAPAIERKRGFDEVIRAVPRMKVVRSETADFTQPKGKTVMASFLKAESNNIQVVYAHNDDMALGAIQALEEAGLKPAKDVIVIGVDAVKGAFEAMRAGKMNVTVECNPLIGPQLMDLVRLAADGKPIPKRVQSREGVFPMEIAEREYAKRKY
ncbi:MAG: ABC transporter substrate-binding protein [Rhodoferax sp.]|nr:ABC transporter substrate-binding protein [Rhodoferax sp.]